VEEKLLDAWILLLSWIPFLFAFSALYRLIQTRYRFRSLLLFSPILVKLLLLSIWLFALLLNSGSSKLSLLIVVSQKVFDVSLDSSSLASMGPDFHVRIVEAVRLRLDLVKGFNHLERANICNVPIEADDNTLLLLWQASHQLNFSSMLPLLSISPLLLMKHYRIKIKLHNLLWMRSLLAVKPSNPEKRFS